MGSEWKSVALKDAAKFFSGGTPLKSKSEYWGGDIPWVSSKSIAGSRYNDSELKLTEAGLKKGSRLAPKNAILLSVRGWMLHERIPVGIATRDVAFNQDVKAIVPNEDFLPLYFYYCFAEREHEFLSKVENTGIGAGKLDIDVLHKIEFYCPPLVEQKAIAHVLGSLDDKIELNRRMNKTLESTAQALFKSWFVDFELNPGSMDKKIEFNKYEIQSLAKLRDTLLPKLLSGEVRIQDAVIRKNLEVLGYGE